MTGPQLWTVHNRATGDNEELSDRQVWDLYRACFSWLPLEAWEKQDTRTQTAFLEFITAMEDEPDEKTDEEVSAKGAEVMASPSNWDRGRVNDWIMEATHEGLWPGDALVDILIVKAQELGIEPADLRQFIYECLGGTELRYAIYAEQLQRWARPALNPDPTRCGHCGEPVDDPGNHECNGRSQPK